MTKQEQAKRRRAQVQRQRDAINREMAAAKRAAGLSQSVGHGDKQAARDAEAQYRLMPRDTRNLTGLIMGDPIPNDPRRYWLTGASA